MSEEVKKVLANCAQNLSDSEKLQARTNIGAIGGVRVTDTSGTTDLVPDEQGRVTVDLTNAGKVQSDWEETNPNEASYIKNKPTIPPAPVQSDWAEADNSSLAFIQNKPENLVQDPNYVHTDNNFTNTDKGKLDGIEAGAEKNVQADWNQSDPLADDYIKNKPSIPQQVQSDWGQSNSTDPSYIQNKPNLATVATSGSYNDLSDKPDIPSQQVQSDWAETNTTNPAYIKNKPATMETKALVAGTNIEFASGNDSVTINAKATKVATRSAPYTTEVELSEMGIYDPGQDYGSVVKGTGGDTIGFLAPKHYGEPDQGKVLTVVNDNGYKMEWRPAPQARMDLKVLTQEQVSIESDTGDYQLTVVDGKAYDLTLKADRSVRLVTNSESTVHTILSIHNNDTSICGGVHLLWRDEALRQHDIYLMLYNEPAETAYYFDVYIKKVAVNGTPYAIARVSDYPCAYRDGTADGYTNNNINFIGRNY